MKKLMLLLSFLILNSCSDDNRINNCNYLQNLGINRTLNLNLPSNGQLLFPLSPVYIPNEGNAGIYVIRTVSGQYRAWDAADPNHPQENCSFMERDGIVVTCGCVDENKYDLVTGQSRNEPLPCGLKEYRVTVSGNNLLVSN
ncbi:hypothetical protein ESY86_08555 [Subsaximicrobium wynnwilliamsii]|uniref:Rieske domain-containing protein n=1 Tax=Subsaximicrobium wynnwilliamsii TaxID=291179 RepID=A0A5C6ZJD1_9FLAO|nr:hypothetical protein [Subsaximicrobium wynnwilliamsii]TXD83692.1 hypothetical protein ESY87_08650 [Subsaximicrobium wynnwilliamsii]TXD89424.1 hypothetical protein ESY86_08555 [Subsaximicrobium wynnwilliamsii]TXE03529.1 hypothetical protein ESY88_07675 [Subsaximicrobium wynnwilliamsii]